jgi:hypothetical protein
MSDEIRGILKDFSKHIHVATLSKMGSASPCEEFAREAETFLNQALSAIREAIPRMVVIDKDKLANLITFELEAGGWCLMSTFLNSGDVTKVASALCEQVGELVRVKE